MNGRAPNAPAPGSHPKPSKFSQETRTSAGLPQSPREQSPINGGFAQDEPLRSTKRRFDTTSEPHPLPAVKRTRLEETETQQHRAANKESEKAVKTAALQQPKPNPPKHRYASFLQDYVDPDRSGAPESVNTTIAEWLESVGSHRERRCRSDSYLRYFDSSPVPRHLTRSVPAMAYTRDADGFAVPPTPTSTGSRSYAADTDADTVAPSDTGSSRSSSKSLVETTFYRSRNLAVNGIHMRHIDEEFPGDIASLVNDVGKDRGSPGPAPAQLWHDADLHQLEMGAEEPDVEQYFRTNIFPFPKSTESLKRSDKQPMSRHAVPTTGTKLRVSNPVPDMLYGYSNEAFPRQQAQLIAMGTEMSANNQGLLYPFFAIEFKGDGPGGMGSLWVATNQCLGGSASCINIAERLNSQLRNCKADDIRPISSAAFSIAMNGSEARLYVSWKHNDLDYYMRRVKSFLLQEPEHYLEFRKYVLNIIEWGRDKRLNEIRDSLDTLLQESRKRASEAVTSSQPPSDSSPNSRRKRQKSSSSRRSSSRSDSVQGRSWGEDKPEVGEG